MPFSVPGIRGRKRAHGLVACGMIMACRLKLLDRGSAGAEVGETCEGFPGSAGRPSSSGRSAQGGAAQEGGEAVWHGRGMLVTAYCNKKKHP